MQFVTVFPNRKIVVSLLRQFILRRVSSGCFYTRSKAEPAVRATFDVSGASCSALLLPGKPRPPPGLGPCAMHPVISF